MGPSAVPFLTQLLRHVKSLRYLIIYNYNVVLFDEDAARDIDTAVRASSLVRLVFEGVGENPAIQETVAYVNARGQ